MCEGKLNFNITAPQQDFPLCNITASFANALNLAVASFKK